MPNSDIDCLVEALAAIASNPSDNFLELVRSAKLDPARDFVGADLTGMDLSGLDLTNFDFTGADLTSTNLRNSLLRSDRLRGAKLNRSEPRFVDPGNRDSTQAELAFPVDGDQQFIEGTIRTYRVQRYALERIALLVRAVQDATSIENLEHLFDEISRTERSRQVLRFIQKWRNSEIDIPKKGLIGLTLDVAIRTVYPLNRPALIQAIGRHVNLTPVVCDYFRRLLRRSRSVRTIQAIEANLRSGLEHDR